MKAVTTEKILLEFNPNKENLLPALKEISAAFGYISDRDSRKVADYFSLSLSEVFETASFYDLIRTKKSSGVDIQICSGTNCTVGNASKLLREMENYLGIRAGDEFNPKIKLEVVSCLGKCGEGPIVIVNGKVFTNVTISGIREIIEAI